MVINLLKSLAQTGGEWVIYVLILCSIAAVAVIVERALLLAKEKKELAALKPRLKAHLEEGALGEPPAEFAQSNTLPAKVLTAAWRKSPQGWEAVEEEIASVTTQEKQRLELRMIVLGTLGNNAVYIGLFGTVLGVIKAFRDLAQEAGAGPEVVMQGLSEALIATAVGLLVALPCVIAYNILQKLIADLLAESEAMAHSLLARLKSRSAK